MYLNRDSNNESCSGLTQEQEDLEETILSIENCLKHSCIIDTKKKRYIRITRDPEYIIEVLKGNVYIYD